MEGGLQRGAYGAEQAPATSTHKRLAGARPSKLPSTFWRLGFQSASRTDSSVASLTRPASFQLASKFSPIFGRAWKRVRRDRQDAYLPKQTKEHEVFGFVLFAEIKLRARPRRARTSAEPARVRRKAPRFLQSAREYCGAPSSGTRPQNANAGQARQTPCS
jgi:hypothetical protein